MTILPPPRPRPRHECSTPAPLRRESGGVFEPAHQDSTLWECPACGRWWKCKSPKVPRPSPLEVYYPGSPYSPAWRPVRWYDIPARRRIAAHETEKWHAQLRMTLQRTTARLHWWDCHPNPKRGRP